VSGDLAGSTPEAPVQANQPASQPAPSEGSSAREYILKTLQSMESNDSSAPATQPPAEEQKLAPPEAPLAQSPVTTSTQAPEQPAQPPAATIVSLSQGQYLVKIDGASNKKIGIDVQVEGVSVQGSPFYF